LACHIVLLACHIVQLASSIKIRCVSQRKIQAQEERTCVAASLGCASLGWRGGMGVAKVYDLGRIPGREGKQDSQKCGT